MALQDLTPQLRTRLSRMERAVGWFVILATALLLFGFLYYVYNTARRKGWFLTKIHYQTSISTGAGLKVGDPVKLMGFDVGEITRITPNDPYDYYNITIDFRIKHPNDGYIWGDSVVKVAAGDFLGNRYLEVVKGANGPATVLKDTNGVRVAILRQKYVQRRHEALVRSGMEPARAWQALNDESRTNLAAFYTNYAKGSVYWLNPMESPAVTERLERLVSSAETALPNILQLTNQLAEVLSNSALLTANLNDVAANAQPVVSNLALVTAGLNKPGALGEWLLPTNVNERLNSVLGSADTVLDSADTNLAALNVTLLNLANLTSNLNQQVEMNTNLLSGISKAVQDADDLVQGLKRHWLLRSAFKASKTNTSRQRAAPVRSPKARD